MPFAVQFCLIISLFLLNVASYLWTFFNSFAVRNKEFYEIISIFNDFIFIFCLLATISALKKAKFISAFVFLSLPLIYTLFLILNFR